MAQASSAYEKVNVTYKMMAAIVAIASPSVPPWGRPRFQPKYIPEMTYPTPRPHNSTGPSVRDNACCWVMPKDRQSSAVEQPHKSAGVAAHHEVLAAAGR